ncbi:MAG: lysozyme [Bacteroidales bacterium]|nr:lysozyme [Bacteroidales bacterium]
MPKITTISQRGIQLIEQFECSGNVNNFLKAYLCPAGVWTIGIGTTVYSNGQKVKQGDICTSAQAYDYLRHDLAFTERQVDSYTTDAINQNQFDALVSFAYNVGVNALKSSTLLKKVNADPSDLFIRNEFMRWVYGGGKKLPGLIRRREAEANLYFT